MSKSLLKIKNLHVTVEGKEILKGVSLNLEAGKIHALMGPNGSGKSTLAYAIVGHPKYKVKKGEIIFEGKNITKAKPDIRAKMGIFLSWQNPKSIPGISMSNFLRTAYKEVRQADIRVFDFHKKMTSKMKTLNIPLSFMERSVNEGFSGGEKKKSEILQAMILEPKVVIMDETDSGLDVDALKIVAKSVKQLLTPNTTILLITHHCRILHYLQPDIVQVMKAGKIVAKGDSKLAKEIEKKGFGKAPKLQFNILD